MATLDVRAASVPSFRLSKCRSRAGRFVRGDLRRGACGQAPPPPPQRGLGPARTTSVNVVLTPARSQAQGRCHPGHLVALASGPMVVGPNGSGGGSGPSRARPATRRVLRPLPLSSNRGTRLMAVRTGDALGSLCPFEPPTEPSSPLVTSCPASTPGSDPSLAPQPIATRRSTSSSGEMPLGDRVN